MTESDDMATTGDWKNFWDELDWTDPNQRENAIRERLRLRAEQYAAPMREVDDSISTKTLLVFELGSEIYGVDVMTVRNVRRIDKVMPVPGTPRFYTGVVNIRGKITTVLDLRMFFDMTVASHEAPGELIVVGNKLIEIGILADHVRDVMSVPTGAVEPLNDVRYAEGLVQGRVIWLDMERLLEDKRLIIGGIDE